MDARRFLKRLLRKTKIAGLRVLRMIGEHERDVRRGKAERWTTGFD